MNLRNFMTLDGPAPNADRMIAAVGEIFQGEPAHDVGLALVGILAIANHLGYDVYELATEALRSVKVVATQTTDNPTPQGKRN